ncbi:MAG: protein kinase [Phycisphaerales bacterium]
MLIRAAAVAAVVAVAPSSQGALLGHETWHVLQQTSGGVTQSPLAQMQFVMQTSDFGMSRVTQSDGSVVTNPLYEGRGMQGENPLYNGDLSAGRAALTVNDIQFIEWTFGAVTWSLHSEGVVHRDVAARNVLLRTTQGDYMSAAGEELIFSSEAGLRADVGPIRWMAPESMRLYLGGQRSADYIDITPFAFFDSIPVPAPASALPLAAGMLALRRRR